MNYKNIYQMLISRALNRDIQGYTEKHHIIPKCLGGSDDQSNIVSLTAEEHYVAHQLLVKIYPENGKLIFAVHMMTRPNGKHTRSNKEYSWIKRRRSEYISKISKGVKRAPYSKKKIYQDLYLTAIDIYNFLMIEESYKMCKPGTLYMNSKDVQNIFNICWTYNK